MKCAPIILNSLTDTGHVLERAEARVKDEKTEQWLQDLIFDHPEILPVREFDESFAPLIPIGREVGTTSGSIDNLYVSPVGRITIVETKLWKNPEKHRTVVAQIIDYAKEVSKWSYDELSEAILKASRAENKREKKSLDQMVLPSLSDAGLTLTDFQERVISTLHGGEFLLLIVGDRISANVALLSETIRGAPGLDFRLGLIELQLYPLNSTNDWPILVIPDIVGRTVEITRGVIKVQFVQEKPLVGVEISEEDIPPIKRGQTTPEVFLQKTPPDLQPVYEQWLKIWPTKGMLVNWGTVGFSLRVTIQGKPQTVLDAYPEWGLSLIRESDAVKLGIPDHLYKKYLDELGSATNAINVLGAGKKYILHESLTAEDLMVIFNATTNLGQEIISPNEDFQG